MSTQKDPKTGKWNVQYWYTDWTGKRKHSVKRGFNTKRDADEWLSSFQNRKGSKLNISFGDFVEIYFEDMEFRLRKSTILSKRYLFNSKILPYFKDKQMDEIMVSDIRKWQNHLIKTEKSATYIKTINNQMAALFNYAVRYYDLGSNPCSKAGTVGKSKADEMNIWTLEEFTAFLDAIIDKPQSYMAFMLLFWTGMRVGELLALTPADIDSENRVIRITKSYQRLKKEDLITEPKTECSRRKITIPEFLVPYIMDYESRIYGLKKNERLFPFTKGFLEHEMKRGVKLSGVKRIRIHDLRHSHLSQFTDRKDSYCWRTAEEFERELGISRKQQESAIKKLEEAGLIKTKNTYIKNTKVKCKHFLVLSDCAKREDVNSTKCGIQKSTEGSDQISTKREDLYLKDIHKEYSNSKSQTEKETPCVPPEIRETRLKRK